MSNTQKSPHPNHATRNVALWIGYVESLKHIARECERYTDFVDILHSCGSVGTPDGIAWDDPTLDYGQLAEFIAEL